MAASGSTAAKRLKDLEKENSRLALCANDR